MSREVSSKASKENGVNEVYEFKRCPKRMRREGLKVRCRENIGVL
jgi:hypothetical protein